MKTKTVNNFGNGMTNDIYAGNSGEFSVSKNFDILTYPNRLFPLPSMQAATSNTGIGNMIVASDGVVYGSGNSSAGGGQGALWKSGATSTTWTENTSNGRTGATTDYGLLVEYKENHATKTILMSGGASGSISIYAIDPADAVSLTSQALSATSVAQGYVHPAYNILFVAYTTATATYVATNNAGSWNTTALTLPKRYRPVSVTKYGNHLAIACTSFSSGVIPSSIVDASVVFLWDTFSTSWQEEIIWGDDCLQVMNNLNGLLIGVSKRESNNESGLFIKAYAGGEVEYLKKILITQATTTISIYQQVNYIHKNRLYFSADLPGGGNVPIYKGLWVIGKSDSGRWALTLERLGTTDGSNGSVLAAIQALDYLHTSTGTVNIATVQFSGSTKATDYVNSATYESVINPEMPQTDKVLQKQLLSVACHYLPLPASGQVIMKYRVDSDNGAWTTIFTETTDNATSTEMPIANGAQFTAGRNYEFQILSTGYAQIVGFSYKYKTLQTNI